MTRLPGLPVLVLSLCGTILTPADGRASRQDDSLLTVLDGVSGSSARAEALLTLSLQRQQLRPGESLIHARNALSFAKRTGDRPLIHRALVQVRDLQHRYGAGDEFLEVAIEAMELSEAMGEAPLMAEDLEWLSVAYEKLGALDRSVEMSRKALFLLSTTGDSAAMGRGMLHLLNALVKAGRFKEVIAQSDEALRFFIDRNDTASQAGIWTRTAEALLEQGRAADALPLLSKAERVLSVHGHQGERMRALGGLARAHHLLGDHERARDHVGTAMAIASNAGARETMPALLALSSRIHESQGDLADALHDERLRQALEDSLLNENIAERMAGMQELYQLDRKERELDDMRTRNAANENLIASGRAHGRWWLAAFVVMLALLVWCMWALFSRRRAVRRVRLKNQVIRQQAEQIHASNMELERRNMRLAESLLNEEEKSAMLKEIHHRVKNNLQIVNALLRLQCEHTSDPVLSGMMLEAQGRVRAMAMVHENLYRLGDLSRIDMKEHLKALAGSVLDSYKATGRITLDIGSQLDCAPLDTMLPLSLLVNELLTNAVKHAFPEGRSGTIRLLINRANDGGCELFYSDDGVGMRSASATGETFGMSLIRAFVQQLDGSMRMITGDGTTLVIAFDPEARRMRKAS